MNDTEIEEVTKQKDFFLTEGMKVISDILKQAIGEPVSTRGNPHYQDKVWRAIIPMLWDVKEIPELTGIDTGTLAERQQCVLYYEVEGVITIVEAKSLFDMLPADEH